MSGRRFGRLRPVKRSVRGALATRLESLERRDVPATFTVTTVADGLPGSLRSAIIAANDTPGSDTIAFNISGGGLHTILLGSSLPRVTDTLTIDGRTQPGFSGLPLIELDGTNAGSAASGLRLAASNSRVYGLAINNFGGDGIQIDGAAAIIQSNLIGTNAGGTLKAGNKGSGLKISSSGNLIGGDLLGTGNVISGNSAWGIELSGGSASSNKILGNFIGTDISGTGPIPNGSQGILVLSGSFNQIGGRISGDSADNDGGNIISGNASNGILVQGATGTTIVSNTIGLDASGLKAIPNGGDGIGILAADRTIIGGVQPQLRNVISANKGDGIGFTSSVQTNTIVRGNYIGTDINGTGNQGNLGAGVSFNVQPNDNTQIGGTQAGAGNVIAFNGATFKQGGVEIFAGKNIAILSNSIHSNVGLGINLQDINDPTNGVTPNDTKDLDDGPNTLQNYPVLTTAGTAVGRTLVQGTLDTLPNRTYRIQFFTNSQGDGSGFGEGQVFLGDTSVTTDLNGHADINIVLNTPTQIGQLISATATDPNNNTSEFSQDTPVGRANVVDLSLTLTDTPDPATINGSITYRATILNAGPNTATNARFDQALPVGVSPGTPRYLTPAEGGGLVPASPPTVDARGHVVANLGDLPKDAKVVIVIDVTPTQVGSITSTATVVSSDIDPQTVDNTATATTSVNIPADLSVDISFAPDDASLPGVVVGQQAAYVISVTNNGPGPSSGVSLIETLPAGVTAIPGGSSSSQGIVQIFGNSVIVNLGDLSAGATATVRVEVLPDTVGTVTTTATATGNEIDPNTADNSVSIDTQILASADLSLALEANSTQAVTDDSVIYKITLFNNGPNAATNVVVTNTLPDGVEFVSATGGVVPVNGVLTFTPATIAANTGTFITITVRIPAGLSGSITDTASVKADEIDLVSSNNSQSLDIPVNPADLSVTLSPSAPTVAVGETLTYTIVVTNNGPATATNVVLKDGLPAGLTPIGTPTLSRPGTIEIVGGVLTARIDSLESQAAAVLTIQVASPTSTILTNTVVVSADEEDTRPENNSASISVPVSPADLVLFMSQSTDSALVGDTITYTLTIANAGPYTATNVVVSDAIAPGLEVVSSVGDAKVVGIGPLNGAVVASIPSLNSGETSTIMIVVRPRIAGFFTNQASVTSDQIDPVGGNDTAEVTATVTNALGQVQFSAPEYRTGDNGKEAVITVTRSGGTQGTIQVAYSASAGSAVAGVHFTPVSGTLTFGSGETTKTFVVPILDDGQVTGDKTVVLALSSTGTTPLGSQTSAVLTINETDVDQVGPTVTDIRLFGPGGSINSIVIAFSEQLDRSHAQDVGNYFITTPQVRGRKGSPGGPVAIASAVYDEAARTVTLTPSRSLPAGVFVQLAMNGATAQGLTDRYGNILDGDANGTPGGNYLATFARGTNLTYADRNGDIVNLRLTGGGVIDLWRNSSGDAGIMRLLGTVPGRTSISGSVRRNGAFSDGVTTLQRIDGLGSFGSVRSRLRTPPFVISNVPPPQNVVASGVRVAARALRFKHGR